MTTGERDLTRRTAGNMAWVAWGSGAVALLKVMVLVILTRLLAPADFGLVSAALVVITFSLNFSQLGLGPALIHRPDLQPRHVSSAFYASTGLGLLVAAIIWLAAPLIAQFFRMEHLTPVVRALALGFPITGIATVPESLLQRDLRFRLLANRDVFSYGIGYGMVGVGMALLGWGVWALVSAQLTHVVLRTAILLRASPTLIPARPTWSSFVELMEYGVGQSISRLGVIMANQADNLVVGRWLGAVRLGEYSRAYQLISVPTNLLGDVLDKVLFPTMARVQDDSRRLGAAFLQGTAVMALVTMPVGVVTAVLAPELVAVAFGSRWAGLVAPFQVLALGMMFRTCYRMSDSLSRATGKVYRRAWRQGLFALLVFLGALAGQTQGLVGVASGVLLAFFLNYVSMSQLSLAITHLSWGRFVQVQLPAVRLSLVVGTATMATMLGMRQTGLPAAAGLVAGVLAAVGSGLVAAWVAPTLALGHEGVRARDMLLGLLPALRKRFVPGARIVRPGPIAFFLPSVRGGGAQRVIVNLVQGIVQRGEPVDLALAVAEGAFLDQLPSEARVVDLRGGRLIGSLAPLIRYLRRERPRVLISSMSHANLVALWAAKLARRATPVMVTVHNTMSESTGSNGGVERRLLRTFYPWATWIVAVSRGAADDLARTTGVPRSRVEVVYNPVITPVVLTLAQCPPDHPWYAPGGPPVILGVGRLTRQKDFFTLVRAFAEVRRRRRARLVILGEGEDRPALEGLVAELGLRDDVSLPGFRDNAPAYMARSALFVLSSAWEGLPTVLIEALAVGTPVVSTDCPSGPREILQEGRLGALTPIGDASALASAMERALDHTDPPVPPDALTAFTLDAAVDHYLRLIASA